MPPPSKGLTSMTRDQLLKLAKPTRKDLIRMIISRPLRGGTSANLKKFMMDDHISWFETKEYEGENYNKSMSMSYSSWLETHKNDGVFYDDRMQFVAKLKLQDIQSIYDQVINAYEGISPEERDDSEIIIGALVLAGVINDESIDSSTLPAAHILNTIHNITGWNVIYKLIDHYRHSEDSQYAGNGTLYELKKDIEAFSKTIGGTPEAQILTKLEDFINSKIAVLLESHSGGKPCKIVRQRRHPNHR